MANIMVIEDVADSANLARKILNKFGHDVILAANGEEAIQFVSNKDIHLVLLDLGLPDVDGQTLLGMLRRNYGMTSIPIIVCTAWPSESAKKMAEAYGFDGYISKPYKVATFMETVNHYLGQPQNPEITT
ncbi:MAG: response regulator [Anaerolineales bacterium]|jgi:CheY-like chemotaxis protein